MSNLEYGNLQKTSKFQSKQAQKQATRKSSKKTLQIHKKTSPNSQENRKVGNTDWIAGFWGFSLLCCVWRFRCPRLPALISPLIDYVPRWIALLCLVVCITRRYQIVSSFVPGGCCVTLQMLMRAGVLSWIKPGEWFRSSLGSFVAIYSTKKWIKNCFVLESCVSNREHHMLAAYLHSG